ncbi:MAG: hypothetical protein QOJ12_1526 [Thermoleophilales bacterium]|nr:hypothetical protein [Thermoleophilales bacterium]
MTRLRLGLAVGILLLLAPAAQATTRYVTTPGGFGLGQCTSPDIACTLPHAIDGTGAAAQDGDTVIILRGGGGDYVLSAGITVRHRLRIQGEAGGARPVVTLAANNATTLTFGTGSSGSSLSHVEVRETGTGAAGITDQGDGSVALALSDLQVRVSVLGVRFSGQSSLTDSSLEQTQPGATNSVVDTAGITSIDRVSVSAPSAASNANAVLAVGPGDTVTRSSIDTAGNGLVLGSGALARQNHIRAAGIGVTINGGQSTVSDSLIMAGGSAAVAPSLPVSPRLDLRNVTALTSGTAPALDAAVQNAIFMPGTMTAKNVIARSAGAADVQAGPATASGCGGPCASGSLAISFSNFRTGSGPVDGSGGGNQNADPLFVSATDFHLQPGSPAIDAGTTDVSNGALDLDGQPRVLGARPDIGAYEATPAAPSTPPPAGAPPPAADTTAPALSSVSVSPRAFAVGSQATAVSARARKRAPKGAKLKYSLSEPATVSIAIVRTTSGRRSGTRCVKPSQKLRKKKKCKLELRAGTLTRAGTAGANVVAFSGRIGTKALKPGSYRAVLTATDAAGNRSKASSAAFKVVRR